MWCSSAEQAAGGGAACVALVGGSGRVAMLVSWRYSVAACAACAVGHGVPVTWFRRGAALSMMRKEKGGEGGEGRGKGEDLQEPASIA